MSRWKRNWRMYLQMLIDPIIETLLVVILWSVQICAVIALPAGLYWFSTKVSSRSARLVVKVVSVALLVAILLCLVYVLENPWVEIPEEYVQHVDETEIGRIRSYSKGFYSKKIPLIAVFVRVEQANDTSIEFTIYYFCSGNMRVELSREGFYVRQPLLGW